MLLNVENLTIRIGREETVRSSSFSVPEGSITALIGKSGSGKSLTCLALSSLLPKGAMVSGRILFKGEDLLTLSEGDIEKIRGRGISYVFQDAYSALNPVYTIEKQLKRINRSADANRLLSRFSLDGKGKSYPFELSGGMLMRAEVMMAVSLSPSLLIADEITAALDRETSESLMKTLSSTVSPVSSILLVTHDLDIAERYADRIVVMNEGTVVEEGAKERVFSSPSSFYTKELLSCWNMEKDEHGRLRASHKR